MPLKATPNYNLKIADSVDNDITFLTFRTEIAGSQSSSNFVIIDTELARISKQLSELSKSSTVINVSATKENDVSYVADVEKLKEYTRDMLIVLSLNETSIGLTSVNINSFGGVFIKRYDYLGNLIDIQYGDLKKNKNYLLRYDGSNFILISPVVSTDLNVNGVSGNLISISDDNVMVDSGISIQDVNNKVDKLLNPIVNHVITTNENGELQDGGLSIDEFALIVKNPICGNLVSMNKNGKLINSDISQDIITDMNDKIFESLIGNPFLILLDNLEDVVCEGIWNQELQRLEC